MALEDKATVLRRNLSATDRQQAIRAGRFGAEIEKLGKMAHRLGPSWKIATSKSSDTR
jgi:hypothetical protein